MNGPILSTSGLGVTLAGARIVQDASLTLSPGELVTLLGPNGSGKTTLIRAVLKLVAHDAGRIDWHGGMVTQLAAYLPQSPTDVPGQTVGQAILAGRFAHRSRFDFVDRESDIVLVRTIAEQLDLAGLLDRPIDRLSGGQRQRVYLARCLAQQTPALLLDEPATFLDLRHQLELYRLLRSLAREQGKAVLMASHDLNLAAVHSDRMILLDGGRIVADGPPATVMDPELIERVYGVRMHRTDVNGIPHLFAGGDE